MHKSYNELIANGVDKLRVKLVSGTMANSQLKKLVGYCHCDTHKGYLNKVLMEEHQCIEKKCPFFERYEDYPYWTNLRQRKEAKEKARKPREEQRAQEEKKTAAEIRQAEKYIYKEIREKSYPIEITNVSLQRCSQTGRKYFIVNYVSDLPINDKREYQSIVLSISLHVGGGCVLRHVKDPCGNFVTTEQWHQFCEERDKKERCG